LLPAINLAPLIYVYLQCIIHLQISAG
jgi:hypothetical protein